MSAVAVRRGPGAGVVRSDPMRAPGAVRSTSALHSTPTLHSFPVHGLAGLLLALFSLVALASPAIAQRPAELMGRVVERAASPERADRASGAPVEGVRLELVEAGAHALSDAAGAYRFRAVSPGRYTLRVARIGYRTRTLVVELEAGRTHRLDVALEPAPVDLTAIEVQVRGAPPSGVRIERGAIERSGARSAADVVASVPSVVVRSTVPGGPQTVSIRGSAPDAVLVLVDGIVLNDPITGEADLSAVAVESIESITVLSGAQSARYGPRAQAGVILVETRRAAGERALRVSAGSLADRSAGAVWSGTVPIDWTAGAVWRSIDGAFDYDLPEAVGGGSGRRENADFRTVDAWLSVTAGFAGGALRARGGFESTDRGLPGRGYAPARHARQQVERLRASATWDRPLGHAQLRVALAASGHRIRYRDPAPPFGLPYDDTASVRSFDARIEADGPPPDPGARGLAAASYGAGIEVRRQSIETDMLAEGIDPVRMDLGLFAHAGLDAEPGGVPATFGAQLRIDRDPAARRWVVSRSLTAGIQVGPLRIDLSNRSSFSPPTLGDQFFRDAIGVEPNPDLRAERVPSEFEIGLRLEGGLGFGRGSLDAALYQGDIRDMIVWAPDYRFVWSPTNVDVNRRGGEMRGELEAYDGRLRLGARYAYAQVTYDREGGDDVQVIYRPRHTAALSAALNGAQWRLDAEARYTGVRYPVAAAINALPGFWTVAAGVARDWHPGDWRLTGSIRADRLFDGHDTLIFGFPEPGRVVRLGLTLTHENASTESTGGR